MLAHYAFDACDGTDSAGGGFHALLPTTVTCIDGPMGGAVTFDGRTGAVVEIPVLPTGAASRSIAAWVRLDGGGGSMADQGIAGWGGISNRRAFSLRYGIGSSYTYGLWLHGCTYDLIVGGGDCVGGSPHEVTGTWHHLAGVYDASQELAILYLDGQETARRVVALDTAATSLGIGMDAEHGVPFHGAIDDLRVYGRALAPDEVRGLHALRTP